jgi:PAS domain S-box-containing protein
VCVLFVQMELLETSKNVGDGPLERRVGEVRDSPEPRTVPVFGEAVMRCMSEGVYALDPTGALVMMNPAAEKLLGLTLEASRGRKIHDLVHHTRRDGRPFDAADCEILAAVTQGRSLSNHPAEFLRSDGSFIDVSLSADPIIVDGKFEGTVVVFRDTTDEKNLRERLDAKDARIRLAVEAARLVPWEWDLQSNIISWLDKDDIVFKGTRVGNPAGVREFFDAVHPEDVERVRNAVDQAVATGAVLDIVYRTRKVDDSLRWISVYGRVTAWRNGKPWMLTGVAADVTTRERASESLIASERKLQQALIEQKAVENALRQKAALLELSHNPIFVWELGAGIVDWNRGAAALYGYVRDEVIGKLSHEILGTRFPNGEDWPWIVDTLEKTGSWSGEIVHFTKDGREVVVETNQQVFESEGRRLVLESNRDITEKKRSELLLERYRLLSEHSRDVIWLLEPDLTFSEVNQAATNLYGYTRDEFLQMSLRDLRHPSTLGDLQSQFTAANDGGIRFETVHVKKDGTPVYVEVSGNGADFEGKRLILAIVRDITDRRRQEDALRESEERRKLAQEAGRVGIWDWDAVAETTYWSETMWSFYNGKDAGVNPDHDYWISHLHPSDRERVELSLEAARNGDSFDYKDEFRIVRRDGTVLWIESIAKIERDADGKPFRMYGVNLDITERKYTEERQRLSENQLRLVTNAVPALISYVDSNERYRFVNEQFTDWFGLPVPEIVGKKVSEVFGQSAYRTLRPKIQEALSGNQVIFETTLNYRAIGNRYVHVSYVPDVGVDGTVYGYYGLTQDFTDIKRSQDLLRSTEERMSLMVESVKDYAILSMDREGNIDSWNTGAELIFGYTRDQIIGRPCDVIFTAQDVAYGVHLKEMRNARKYGQAADERWHIRKDGSRFYASGVTMPLYVGRTLTGYAKILSDLTEKQRRAEELQKAHDELELRVRERTHELAESNAALLQEIEVRRAAEQQRVELLGRLVASQELERRRIARDLHDQLGQRLTALRLKIASLREITAGHAEIDRRVNRLQQIAQRLDNEVSFLAWELRPSALDDLGLVDAIDTYVAEWSNHYEVPAEFHSTGLAAVRLNPETETHLYRIAQEALNNITKHAKASMVTVLLERRGDEVILIIEDNGVGFRAGSEPTSDPSKGLGLVGMGERAQLVGGRTEIESAPGRGTTIFVRVPAGTPVSSED